MKKISCFLILFTFLLTPTYAQAQNATIGGGNISIDGYFDEWNGLPSSYHYNWDNSQNCWQWGEWADIDGDGNPEKYTSEPNTYNNDVRHKIQLHTDGTYIYCHIKIATIYLSQFNGEDYQLKFNDTHMANFQITDQSGAVITNSILHWQPGTYAVQVRHRDSACSYSIAEGASAYLKIYPNHLNSELEFKVPISTCKMQNNAIDTENIESISFFTPNLMYKSIECHGTSTGPIILLVITAGIVIVSQFIFFKRKKGN